MIGKRGDNVQVHITLTVKKSVIQAQSLKLYSLLRAATRITNRSSFASIREAEKQLCRAHGIYELLADQELLDYISITMEDFERIEAKIGEIISEKRLTRTANSK